MHRILCNSFFLFPPGTLLSPITILGSLTLLSYLEETLKILVRHSGYFHEDVRLQAIIALERELLASSFFAISL